MLGKQRSRGLEDWMNGWMEEMVGSCLDDLTEGWMEEMLDRQKSREMDGWIDGQKKYGVGKSR